MLWKISRHLCLSAFTPSALRAFREHCVPPNASEYFAWTQNVSESLQSSALVFATMALSFPLWILVLQLLNLPLFFLILSRNKSSQLQACINNQYFWTLCRPVSRKKRLFHFSKNALWRQFDTASRYISAEDMMKSINRGREQRLGDRMARWKL